jgi:hypothetical protein
MSESDVVSQLVGFVSTLLAGVSVIFTVVSAYIAGLNYFIHRISVFGKLAAFLFLSFVIAMLMGVMQGADQLHAGLIARLKELDAQHQLTAAGRAALANASETGVYIAGRMLPTDEAVRYAMWTGAGLTYFVLFVLTFLFPWRDEQ